MKSKYSLLQSEYFVPVRYVNSFNRQYTMKVPELFVYNQWPKSFNTKMGIFFSVTVGNFVLRG